MAKSVNGANDVCDVFLDDGIMNCTCVCIYIYIYIYIHGYDYVYSISFDKCRPGQ